MLLQHGFLYPLVVQLHHQALLLGLRLCLCLRGRHQSLVLAHHVLDLRVVDETGVFLNLLHDGFDLTLEFHQVVGQRGEYGRTYAHGGGLVLRQQLQIYGTGHIGKVGHEMRRRYRPSGSVFVRSRNGTHAFQEESGRDARGEGYAGMRNERVFVEADLHDSLLLSSHFIRRGEGEGYGLRLRRRMGAGMLDRSLRLLGVRGSGLLGLEIYPRGVLLLRLLREGRRGWRDQMGELRVELQLLLVCLRLGLQPLLLLPQGYLLLLLLLLLPRYSRSLQ